MAVMNNLKFDEFDLKLKDYAKEYNVPIILDDGLSFLESMIKIKKPLRILEIGTAIGYSSIRMVKASNAIIDTIERNDNMYSIAIANIKEAKLDNRINVIFKDALEAFEILKDNKYDLIFIDAAKAQYHKFFDIYKVLLNDDGIIICDNMLFHGLVESESNDYSRSVRGLIRKLKEFHEYLLNNDEFSSVIYDIGDGMALSIKK